MTYNYRRIYTPLCPRCLRPMIVTSDGSLYCPQCRYKIYKHYQDRVWQRKPNAKSF